MAGSTHWPDVCENTISGGWTLIVRDRTHLHVSRPGDDPHLWRDHTDEDRRQDKWHEQGPWPQHPS